MVTRRERAMTSSPEHDIILPGFNDRNQNNFFFFNLEMALLPFWCSLVITPLYLWHSNKPINWFTLNETRSDKYTLAMSYFLIFFFLSFFSFCQLFSILQTVWRLKKNCFFVRFGTFKNNLRICTLKCHHNYIHECTFFFPIAAGWTN